MKRTVIAILALMMVVLPFSTAFGQEKATYKIGITQIITHPALDLCRKGFIDQLAKEGFTEGVNVTYDYRNVEGDMSLAASIAQKFVAEKVDLIFSIATPTTQASAKAVEGTDVPVVFGALTDPVAAGVVDSWEKPGGNVTGCSDWADVGAQVKLAMDIHPGIKKLGVIYNAGEINSVVQVKELKKAAPALGIEKVVEATAATTADIYAAAMSLVGRVDAIWEPTDNTVAAAMESIVKVAESNKIPLFGSDISMAKRGAISGAGLDYYVNGVEAGKLAARILRGEKAADIAVTRCPITIIYLSPKAAERMGISIPANVLERATEIGS
ncbi:MAG: ABC transporter substrate-binding protein [Deltaproteobacteria bacterium]|nr:ABC transporter substrate-binding protein [Deltaproteobacteria bacterium]MBN2845111.1 ABC transporter substrate-binding protein [Deltaproteobacteria bacterium]